MAATIIAGIGVAVAATGTGVGISNAAEQKKKASEANDRATAQANDLLTEEKKQSLASQVALENEADVNSQSNARKRQKALAAGAQGRQSTIATSNAGLVGAAPVGASTLLGA